MLVFSASADRVEPVFSPAPDPLNLKPMLLDVAPVLPPAPLLTEQDRLAKIAPEEVLSDPLQRISPEFQVPEALKQRTEFWFDVYTKYGTDHHVIHHSRYPWIKYDVIDGSEEVAAGKGPLWLRRERVRKTAHARQREIRRALKRLSERPHFRKLSGLELALYKKLKPLKGPRRQVLRLASQSVRSQLGQRDFFIAGLRRSTKYLSYMEQIFQHAQLPIELTRMPFVESSFNETAHSKVGASGIWQIMPYTGRAYFVVTDQIDERQSPLKSTMVAANLLQSYYRAMKSWPLAITSYNHGIGNIQQAIRAARTRDLPKIIDRYHEGDFKFASSNFFTSFLAALHAERYSEILFPAVSRFPLLTIEQIRIARSVSVGKILELTGLNREALAKYNQDLRGSGLRRLRLPKGYLLHLPPGHALPLSEKMRARIQLSPLPLPKITEIDPLPGIFKDESHL